MRQAFETGDTVKFTWVSSVAPDAAPVLSVTGIAGSVLEAITSVASDSGSYYAFYTLPSSAGEYLAKWHAEKTFNAVVYSFQRTLSFVVVEPART